MLGERIRELRESRGFSQTDLANHLGKSKQSISNWENNNILPSIEMLMRLSCFFAVSCDYLLELDERKYLEINGLSEQEIAHIQMIIEDIRKKREAGEFVCKKEVRKKK